MPMWTTFPHPNYSTLDDLMEALNDVYQQDPNQAPKIVFIMKGTFQNTQNTNARVITRVFIRYPMTIIGAGQNKTYLSGYSFNIQGIKEEGKRVVLKDMTTSSGELTGVMTGVFGNNGLSFLCDSMTFTQCGKGVSAYNSTGRLINCIITHCSNSGIYSGGNSLIEVEGSLTKVEGNVTDRYACTWGCDYGLYTYDASSRIHLLSPLTKESVSTNNPTNRASKRDYGGKGTIRTVDEFLG